MKETSLVFEVTNGIVDTGDEGENDYRVLSPKESLSKVDYDSYDDLSQSITPKEDTKDLLDLFRIKYIEIADHPVVCKIDGKDNLCLDFIVDINPVRETTEKEHDDFIEFMRHYLLGQCSDGWGEDLPNYEEDGISYHYSPWTPSSECILVDEIPL